MKRKIKVLVVEDDTALQKILEKLLTQNNYEPVISNTVEKAFKLFRDFSPDIVLSDLMLDDGYGLDLMYKIQKINNNINFIIMTAFGSVENAVNALKKGAYDYITKPIDMDKLLKILSNLKELILLREEIKLLKQNKNIPAPSLIGNSEKIRKIATVINQIKDIDTTVLITGETGVGKEVVAKNIHFASMRAAEPFVSINCAAIPTTLMESELFGAEKGSYTGADKTIIGKFEYAKNGTIFLDEISEMDIGLQAKLLRILQEKAFYRLGGTNLIYTNARIIAATNKKLEDLIKKGLFREDLFYRLNILPIYIPPLRERIEDIPLLTQFFLENFNTLYNKKKYFSKGVPDYLCSYNWPGNIRELENAVQRAFILSTKDEIEKKDFDFLINNILNKNILDTNVWSLPPARTMLEYEKIIIDKTLKYCKNNKSKSAKLLGISERSLYYKLKNTAKIANE